MSDETIKPDDVPAELGDDAAPEPAAAETAEPAEVAGEAAGEAAGDAETPEAESPPATEVPDAAKPAPKPRRARFPGLMRAYRTGWPVDGVVVGVIKGGYEIRVGQARGFCPHSQIDVLREDNPERHIGESYKFRITQVRRGGDDIVLSRRAVIDAGRAEEAKAVRATLVEGAVMQGHVAGTAAFGAFIDLGAGVMGLAHISELSHQRVRTVDEAVKVGDTVQVKLLKINDAKGKISLSIRQAQEDPWSGVAERFTPGQEYAGTVRRVAEFGVFVEVAPGVEALAPASEFPPASVSWHDTLVPGFEGRWHVLAVDGKARRISVTPPGEGGDPAEPIPGSERSGFVQRIERYGVFVWLGPGRVGLMPRAWTGAGEGADLDRLFPVGQPVDVTVVEVAEDGRRIRLAKKGVDAKAERREAQPRTRTRPRRDESPPAPTEPQEAFGTSLAEKLRAALGGDPGEG